ncbi:VOC family protein [Intestinibacter sp.]
MEFKGTLICVGDMEKSKKFYKELLGLDVVADFGANVTLTGGIVLQTLETWREFIDKEEKDIILGNNAVELYFEEDDMDGFIKRLKAFDNIIFVHELIEHSWGQRVIRFYDPDKHIIEVGENIVIVVKRFLKSGLSIEETANRMDVPIEFVNDCLKE